MGGWGGRRDKSIITKGARGSAGKDQGRVGWRPGGPRVQWVAPERTQVARGDAKEDQGRVGRHPEGPRVDWLTPGRMITVVVITVVIVVVIVEINNQLI